LAGSGGSGGRSERDASASNPGGTGGSGQPGQNGSISTIQSITCYADTDGDGFGDPSSPMEFIGSCGAGFVSNALDCDDNNSNVFPGNPEVCDGVDNDCNSVIDDGLPFATYYLDADGDGFGDPSNDSTDCSAPSGYVSDNTDCDDADPNRFPGNPEVCDGVDNDCNGVIDDGLSFLTYYQDSDGDGYGNPASDSSACAPPSGYVTDNTDCDDSDAGVNPGVDSDGDGSSVCIDCDDNNPNVFPGNPEICDGFDNDCDGIVDCVGNRGDANGDGADHNILDLTYIVDFIFRGGPASPCPVEADINSDGTPHNILDLTYLVDYIFRGGPLPGPC